MTGSMPIEFGDSYESFVQNWHLGGSIGYSRDDVVAALGVLKRLWPEKISETTSSSLRGLGFIVPLVELGLMLRDCEGLEGIAPILVRLKSGERSAYAELVVGAALARLGFAPSLDAPLNGKLLDARCDVENVPVYFEVICPERSDRSAENLDLANDLREAVASAVSHCRIEVVILSPLTSVTIDLIAEAVKAAKSGEWTELENIAQIRRIDEGERLAFDPDGLQCIFLGERETQGAGTSTIISWEDVDDRAVRQFKGEYGHFSSDVANVLVVDICAPASALEAWSNAMPRVLQPRQHRNVGAVFLFWQGLVGPGEQIRRSWKVFINPFAHVVVPKSLIEGIQSIDESRFLGGH